MSVQLERAALHVTEAQFQRTVIELARVYGWKVFHDRIAWRSDPGWLDITAVHCAWRRTIYMELKSERGRVTVAQRDWIDVHEAAGDEVYCVRPSNWTEIVRIFSQPERPGEAT